MALACLVFSASAQEVTIPDPGLNSAIREALQKPTGPLTQSDLLSLTNLLAGHRNISSVEGLENARNLRILDLDGNSITNFNLPAELMKLTQLDLSTNQLTELTLPPEASNLTALFVNGNPLTALVLSEPLAVTNLASTVATLRNDGVQVFAYPLTIGLLRPRPLTGAFQFGITGPPGEYGVFASGDLADWSEVGIASNAVGSVSFVDVTANDFPRRYYQALRQTPPANMVFIPPNTFIMGSPATELHRQTNEGPQTVVRLTHGFWIGKFEVTQGEYLSVMNTNPSYFPGDLSRPVSSVSWFDSTNYCAKLTQRELAAGRIPLGSRFRLPTEAEWECAARAGTTTRFSYGDDLDYSDLANHAWFILNSGFPGSLTVHPVGQKLPNPWGLYDMEGNVWEWTQDWLGELPGGAVTDPQGPAFSPIGSKVVRGGSYDFDVPDCRSARRSFSAADDTDIGFRVALVIGTK